MNATSINRDHMPYRPCVGVALFNQKGQVFVAERIDTPGAWQMPQGGIDPGETIDQAASRELQEETGITEATILEMLDRTLTYDLPDHLLGKLWGGQFRGQEQYWVAMRYLGNDEDIDIDNGLEIPEFSQWKWVELETVFELIVPFKQDVYREIAQAFGKYTTPLQ